jgi:hypothetical protein
MLVMAAPFHAITRETLGIAYRWTQPFVLDDSRYCATFGSPQFTPLDEALAATIAPVQNGAPA